MTARYRKVNLYGGRYVIELLKADVEDLNIKVGDLIDIEDAIRKTSVPQELESITNKPTKRRKKK